jgi:hypothetical protein
LRLRNGAGQPWLRAWVYIGVNAYWDWRNLIDRPMMPTADVHDWQARA